MSNIRMLIDNLWDDCTLSLATGTAVTSLPLSHSQRYGRSYTAAITPTDDTSIINFELTDLQLASGLVLYRHWLSNVAKWRLELFDSPAQTGNCVFDSALQPCVQTKTLGELDWLVDPLVSSVFDHWAFKFSQLWFAPVFFRSGRLTLVDSDARDGLHEFDRIYLGRVFEPAINFSWGAQHQWRSEEKQQLTAAGSSFATERARMRQLSFSLDYLTDGERPHMSNAIAKVGLAKDWFISLFPNQGGQQEIDYAMSCKLTEIPKMTNNHVNNHTVPMTVKEA